MTTRIASFAALSVLCAALGGCYTVAVDYTPMSTLAADAAPAVRIEVEDARSEDQGLGDAQLIGQYRGGFGIPSGVENGTPSVMPETVTAATTDALAGAGVAVTSDADAVLHARVTQYWADGMMGIGSWITVEYSLDGSEWSTLVEAEGGAGGAGNQNRLVEEAIESALVDLADKAGQAFADPAFQAAVGAE